jgi:folate-binding protein YgfZ
VPRYGADVSEANVVLEAGLDDAVSYTKGCYVGQEIIARIHWRGHVAKRLSGLVLDDADAGEIEATNDGGHEGETGTPRAGIIARESKIKSADGAREIGRVASSAFSPRLQKQIALAVIKYDFLAPGTEVLIESGDAARRARVAALPLVRGGWYEDGTGGAT